MVKAGSPVSQRACRMTAADFDLATISEQWDRNAPDWIKAVRQGRDLICEVFGDTTFLDFLPPLNGLEILDLGCGEGRSTRLLATRGARMTGVELSPRLHEAAVEHERRQKLGIEYHCGSFTDLKTLADGAFDAVVSVLALMGSPSLNQTIGEATRVLKPNGFLAFSVHHPCFLFPQARWLTAGQDDVLGIRQYFSHGKEWTDWHFVDGQDNAVSPTFTRYDAGYCFEDYINAVTAAGLRLRAIREPIPTDTMVARLPILRRHQTHAGLFLYVLASKD